MNNEMNNKILAGSPFKGVSKKTGNEYYYIDLVFPAGYSKRVFLTLSEYIIATKCSGKED